MSKRIAVGCAVAAAAVVAGTATATPSHRAQSTLSALDKHFLTSSAQGDAFEIRGGKLAQSKGQSTKVKALGKRLMTDHTKSLSDLAKLASKLGVKIEKTPTPPEAWELKQVGTMTGTSFDRGYASLEVADHIQDIKDTSEEINSGTNASVRALAKQDLPMLKTHLKLSRQALAAG